MLDTLSSRLSKILKTMRGQARLTEENTREMTREIRLALLEADVALPVVKELVGRIKEKALGTEVVGSLNPGQALVGIVEKELTSVIGGDLPEEERSIRLNVQPPAVMLKTVSAQAGCDFFPSSPEEKPLDIARSAMDFARRHFYDVVIADTAGRLAIDEAMMQEVKLLSDELKPAETLFVIDAMLGQDAVNTAKAFNDRLNLTGIVLTKVDGDSRGGAALSVRWVTGKPIKFVGTGEKLNGFEAFNPQQMAGRILGMGDIVALVKNVQETVSMEEAAKLAKKLKTGERFDLEDFKAQISQMKTIGVSGLIDKLPAQFQEAAAKVKDADVNKTVGRTEGIINSMTPKERRNPDLIKASRKRRIATGAGVSVQEVNRLLKQFEQTRDMMKKMQKGGLGKMMRALGSMGLGRGIPGLRR